MMLTPEQTFSEIALPALDARQLVRRLAAPLLVAAAATGAVVLLGGQVHAVASVLRRALGASPGWVGGAVVLEGASLAAYVWLLWLVAGRASARIGLRESAQITLAGAAATRLLPTAGAGGAALTLWTLRRAGLGAQAAGRALITFFVLLYAVFLSAIVVAGAVLVFGIVPIPAPAALSAIPALAGLTAIVLALLLSRRAGHSPQTGSRIGRTAHLLGHAIRDARHLIASADLRLAGAVGYWLLDAAVLWGMLHAFGGAPAVPVVLLAYLIGQVSNTIPIPGSVSGGMTGMLAAFGVPLELALPAVLTYRTVAVWLPLPVAIAAVPALRTSVARWEREDAAAIADR